MKLGDFLTQQGGGRPAATREIAFRVVGQGARMEPLTGTARAALVYVPEAARQESFRDAEKALADLYGTAAVPDDRREDERAYQILVRALRDADDVREPFADSPAALKRALVLDEAQRLWTAYRGFMEEEFPDTLDAETFGRLVEEAKKNSLPALISSFGFDAVRRAMPGLLARLRT